MSLNLYNNKDYVDLSDYWKSGTWDIIEVPAYLNVHNDSTVGMVNRGMGHLTDHPFLG